MDVLTTNLGVFTAGLITTLELSLLTCLLAGLLGLGLAVCRISPVLPLQLFSWAFTGAVRAVPLLVLLMLFVFGLPEVGLVYPLYWTVVAAMGLYWAAFFGDVIRSGIRAVPPGQIEAGRALGMTFGQVLRLVVLPQAVRVMVQPLASLLIAVTLNSSLASAVGVTQELTGRTHLLDQKYAQPLLTFGAAAALYIALTLSIGRLAGAWQRKLVIPR
ncbi:amino acid ABC transporter permease [Streptomyces sp. NPDC056632]|uniref:amino acid ABC transporter permease n=1 Tax=Streptomyces sp. NPDC056632 TaxID=3345884 RepID=UPI00367C27AE